MTRPGRSPSGRPTHRGKYKPPPDLFVTRELVEGIHLYTHKIVGVMHFSNILPQLKRFRIIKSFMDQANRYSHIVFPCFHRSESPQKAHDDNVGLILEGKAGEVYSSISHVIKPVIEPDNKYDANAFSIRLNSDYCFSVAHREAIELNSNVYLDVGYLPKEHKDSILDDYAEYFLVGIVPDKRGFIVEIILHDKPFKSIEVVKAIAATKMKKRRSFKDISNMSLRKIRSSLEVD
jgi:hypothetical protein